MPSTGPRKFWESWVFWAVTAGLVLRVAGWCIFVTGDMEWYANWGCDTDHNGLADAFKSIYFPYQYWIFAGINHVAEANRVLFEAVCLPFTLLCDLAAYGLLVVALRAVNCNPRWALHYWLNPYVVMTTGFGYIDAHMTLLWAATFALLLRHRADGRWWLAGFPFAFAVLMKPQVLAVALAMVILFMLWLLELRTTCRQQPATRAQLPRYFREIGYFILPSLATLLFASYVLRPRGWLSLIEDLFESAAIAPTISCYFPNVWEWVGRCVRATPDVRVCTIRDQLLAVGSFSYREIGMFVTMLWFLVIGYVAIRRAGAVHWLLIALALVCGPVIVPYWMTAAHENHFYLAMATLIVPLAMSGRRWGAWAYQLLALVLGLNVFLNFLISRTHFGVHQWLVTDAVIAGSLVAYAALLGGVLLTWPLERLLPPTSLPPPPVPATGQPPAPADTPTR